MEEPNQPRSIRQEGKSQRSAQAHFLLLPFVEPGPVFPMKLTEKTPGSEMLEKYSIPAISSEIGLIQIDFIASNRRDKRGIFFTRKNLPSLLPLGTARLFSPPSAPPILHFISRHALVDLAGYFISDTRAH